MTNKPTPGPWTITKCPCGHASCNYYGTSNGSFEPGNGYSLEDARLIVSTHGILEALLEFYDATTGEITSEAGVLRILAARKTALAAIAKARGVT